MRCFRCLAVAAAMLVGACDLVLGIDDVSPARGPDSGQRSAAASREPEAGLADDDAAAPEAAIDDAGDDSTVEPR